MPFSISNNFMDNRKAKTSVVDELALAKSAAWAWHEHGSGTDGRLIREFDGWRTKIDHKPSRYKLEAMKDSQESKNSPSSVSSTPRSVKSTSRASISLLDKYEVERISKQLDDYMNLSCAKYNGGDNGGLETEIIKSKLDQKKKVPKSFWLGNGMGCSSMVERASLERQRQQRSARGGRVAPAVVDIVGCRPRRTIRN